MIAFSSGVVVVFMFSCGFRFGGEAVDPTVDQHGKTSSSRLLYVALLAEVFLAMSVNVLTFDASSAVNDC